MAARGLSPTGGGVYFGQLLGMADNLTFTLGQHGYEAFKYVPYG
jgi:proline dehydrogenase